MADNYLERRMEDLRSGRLAAASSPSRPSSRKGFISFPFPARRVLIVGGVDDFSRRIILDFAKSGCRVALMDADREMGECLAHDHGIRFHNVDVHDFAALEKAFLNLLAAWKDIDIIVCIHVASGSKLAERLAALWEKSRMALPYPNDFGGRFLLLSPDPAVSRSIVSSLLETLSRLGITVNAISLQPQSSASYPPSPEGISRLCLFLSLPSSAFLSGLILP